MKKFEDLTKEEKDAICNGCGGKGSKIVPPHAVFFRACCDHHDYGYWRGGTEKDRKRCDKMFYMAMKKDCKGLPWLDRLRYKPWCWVYYRAVRQFGARYFSFK